MELWGRAPLYPMFSDLLLDHFRNPRNVGVLPPPAVTVDVENMACGDHLRLSALVRDGRIVEVAYQVKGCTASIAAGSVLTEWLRGRSLGEIRKLTAGEIDARLGALPPASRHAAVLCVDGVNTLADRLTAEAS